MTTTESLTERDEPVERDGPDETPVGTDLAVPGGSVDTESASLRANTDATSAGGGWLWKVVAGLGAVSLLGAVGVVVLPVIIGQSVQFTNETVRSMRSFALLLGAFVGIFGLYVAYHRDVGDEEPAQVTEAIELPAANPEQSHGPTNDTVGSQLDQHLDRIGGMVDGQHGNQYTAYKVKQNLAALAVRVVADAADCSEARAQELVEQGTWTDDVRAASLVGGPDAPERTLAMRIGDWASGSAFDRQVRATVDELAELDGGDGS